MKKKILVQREYLLVGYRYAINFWKKYAKKPKSPNHESDAYNLILSHFSHAKDVYRKLSNSKGELFEVTYESKEVA